jgi:branched-subunit amino acid aminotransferase/4-amino-4-deoxychorismate lyase
VTESLNRAFMYGESVFTTVRMADGVLRDWDYHFERLRKGAEFVFGPFTEGADWVAILKNRLETKTMGLDGNKVVRLALYREQARGLQKTSIVSVTDVKIHLSASNFEKERIENKMLKLRTCPVNKKPYWWPSYLKAGNYLETIISQKKFLQPGDDDILFLSSEDTILESSVANIFVVRHNRLYTAPAGPDVLEGIMRRKVIDVAKTYFDSFEESETTLDQAFKADAIFGSNSVRGLFLIDQIDGHTIVYNEQFLDKFELLKNRVLL